MLGKIKTVVCGISGGVDSAVAAHLLKQKGYEVIGLFMKNWDIIDETGRCSIQQDHEDAKFVCDHLKIPFHEVSFVKKYWNEVFSSFLKDYQEGLTPNPDILCNKHIKFDAFLRYSIDKLGADAIATGHYAKTSAGEDLQNTEKGVKLLQPLDHSKDQTFFLTLISQEALRKTLFPLGDLTKRVVKEIAVEAGMEKIAKKKESMGICFIGSRKFHQFIEEYIEPKKGNFIHIETGKIVGTHKGTHYWTVGQRALIAGYNIPHYIVELDPSTQDILVAPGANHPSLFAQTLVTEPPYWIHEPPDKFLELRKFNCGIKYQHIHPLINCSAELKDDDKLDINLEVPLRALTKGQHCVFYNGEECLGGAKITAIGPSVYSEYYGIGTVLPEFSIPIS